MGTTPYRAQRIQIDWVGFLMNWGAANSLDNLELHSTIDAAHQLEGWIDMLVSPIQR